MTSNRLALSLTLASSLLVACGGGGDARSPDRPNLRLDPETLRLDFPRGNVLPGTGSNMIPVRLLGLQTDQLNTNLGPELNVTRAASWTITGNLRDPAVATLADDIRNAGSLRDVQDIISSVRLLTNDSPLQGTINATYRFGQQDYVRSSNFTVAPPVPLGAPYIDGQAAIAFNPLKPGATFKTEYKLLQALRDIAVQENQTGRVTFCSTNTDIVSFEEKPYLDSVETTFTSPFTLSNNTEIVSLEIYAMSAETTPQLTCDQLGQRSDPNDDSSPLIEAVARKTIQIIPAIVTSMEVCSITNPAANICDPITGALNQGFVKQCKGLDTNGNLITSVNEPAGEDVQMAAKLVYTNPQNVNQPLLTQYQCSGTDRLSWAVNNVPGANIFDANGLDEEGGFGDFISQSAYEAIKANNPQNKVTATFVNSLDDNGEPEDTISADLTLKLTDATVSAITVTPVDHIVDNTVLLNLVGAGIKYDTRCTFGTVNTTQGACSGGNVSWSVVDDTLIEVDQNIGASVTVNSVDQQTEGSTVLKTTYNGATTNGTPITVDTNVDVKIDPIVSLRLLQTVRASETPPAGAPTDRVEDSFSCLTTTSPTPEPPTIQYHAYALFESQQNAEGLSDQDIIDIKANNPNSGYFDLFFDVTNQPQVTFAAVPGYWAGNESADRVCFSASASDSSPEPAIPDPSDPDFDPTDPSQAPVPTDPAEVSVGGIVVANLPNLFPAGAPPARFSATSKGLLEPVGINRFATVCIRVFIDENADQKYNGPEGQSVGEPISYEGSSVLVTNEGSSDLCTGSEGQVETEQRNSPNQQVTLPAFYAQGLATDPLLQMSDDSQPPAAP